MQDKYKLILIMLILSLIPFIAHLFLTISAMYINVSPSLPLGIYKKVYKNNLEIGDIVITCIPKTVKDMALSRGYVSFGQCQNSTSPIGKYIIAKKGDYVEIGVEGIYVNEKLVDYTRPQDIDSNGFLLKPYIMKRKLKDDELVLANAKLDSFDSRYIGPVKIGDTIAIIEDLYTL